MSSISHEQKAFRFSCDFLRWLKNEQNNETTPKKIGEEGGKTKARPASFTFRTNCRWRRGSRIFEASSEWDSVAPSRTGAGGREDLPGDP
jgi:hypothetical protein